MNDVNTADTSEAAFAASMREAMHALLVRIPGHILSRAQAIALCGAAIGEKSAAQTDGDQKVAPCFHVVHAVEHDETYIYILNGISTQGSVLTHLNAVVQASYPDADVADLQVCQAIAGASAGLAGAWHYVVETDVKPEADSDLNDWYQTEHLPGLASVPGTVLAARLKNPQRSPRYHACYLLQTRETFGSAPWLAVRATDWSSQVRPSFVNTKRTMFRVAG